MNIKNNKEKQNNINKNENFIYIRTYIIPLLLLIIAIAIFYKNWHISHHNILICMTYLGWCIFTPIMIVGVTYYALEKKSYKLKFLKAINNIFNILLIYIPIFYLILYKVFIPLFSYKEHSHWPLSWSEKTNHFVPTLNIIIISLIISLLSKLCIYKINNKKLINNSKNKHAWNILCINIIAIFTLVGIIILMAVYVLRYFKFIDKDHNLNVFTDILTILTLIISYLIYSTINNKIYLKTSWKEYKLIIIPLITAIMSVLLSN